jgi:hypothetical protein
LRVRGQTRGVVQEDQKVGRAADVGQGVLAREPFPQRDAVGEASAPDQLAGLRLAKNLT